MQATGLYWILVECCVKELFLRTRQSNRSWRSRQKTEFTFFNTL